MLETRKNTLMTSFNSVMNKESLINMGSDDDKKLTTWRQGDFMEGDTSPCDKCKDKELKDECTCKCDECDE